MPGMKVKEATDALYVRFDRWFHFPVSRIGRYLAPPGANLAHSSGTVWLISELKQNRQKPSLTTTTTETAGGSLPVLAWQRRQGSRGWRVCFASSVVSRDTHLAVCGAGSRLCRRLGNRLKSSAREPRPAAARRAAGLLSAAGGAGGGVARKGLRWARTAGSAAQPFRKSAGRPCRREAVELAGANLGWGPQRVLADLGVRRRRSGPRAQTTGRPLPGTAERPRACFSRLFPQGRLATLGARVDASLRGAAGKAALGAQSQARSEWCSQTPRPRGRRAAPARGGREGSRTAVAGLWLLTRTSVFSTLMPPFSCVL